MIVILTTHTLLMNNPPTRTAYIYITDGGATAYTYTKGGLSIEGNLQIILNGMEAELWAEAQVSGRVATPKDAAIAEGKEWYKANSAYKDIFALPLDQLEAEVAAHVAVLFPAATAGTKIKETKLRTAQLVNQRVLVRDLMEDLGI